MSPNSTEQPHRLQHTVERLTTFAHDPRVRMIALTLLYLAIIAALVVLYGKGNFSTPPFIYQGF